MQDITNPSSPVDLYEFEYRYQSATSNHRLTKVVDQAAPTGHTNEYTFTYNDQGSITRKRYVAGPTGFPTTDQTTSFCWTEDQQLNGVLIEDAITESSSAHHYLYDHNGIRVLRTNFYTARVGADALCACKQSLYWATQAGFDCASEELIYFYHPDYLGSVEFVTDMRGEPYQFFLNTPWGENLENQFAKNYTSFSSRFRFNGKEWDDETGNLYYGARYYDPKVSVWLSVDPLAAKRTWLTPYNFVQNNPLLRVDPDGNLDICETCPNEPRFDEYRDSPVNYEFTPNGNGGGEIHLAEHQSLQEVEVRPGTNSSSIQGESSGVDPALSGGLAVSGGIVEGMKQSYQYGSQTANYAQKIKGKVRGADVLTRSNQLNAAKMATKLKMVGRGFSGLSLAAAGYRYLNSDGSRGEQVRLMAAVAITAMAGIPIVGPIISIGLRAADAGGAFDDIYNSFNE